MTKKALQMSRIVRKRDFCLCENKGADQLCSNCTADQRLCFRYKDRTIFFSTYVQNFKLLTFFWNCTGQFVLDLVVNPEGWFPRISAQLKGLMVRLILTYMYITLSVRGVGSLVVEHQTLNQETGFDYC